MNKDFENQTSLWRHAAVLIVFALIAVLLYSKAAQGPFVFDDNKDIVNNKHIHISSITPAAIFEAGFIYQRHRRPVSNISFAIGYFVHGLNPFWFRAVNIAIHVLASFFLYLLIGATLKLPTLAKHLGPNHVLAPLFAALIFLVHPVQTQTVSYIVQRMAGLSAMFYVLSLLLYVHGRVAANRKTSMMLFVCSACVFVLSLGSKENAGTLPVVVVLYEWFFFQDLKWSWIRANKLWLGAAFGACVLVFLIYLNFNPKEIFTYYSMRDFSPGQRMLTQLRVVVFYMSLLVLPLPSRMNLEHDFLISTGIFSPLSTLACAVIIAGLLAWAIFNAKKNRIVSFCILWFFINLATESSVIGLELIFEHRLYLPSMFVCAAFAILIFAAIKNRRAAQIALLCVVLLLCMATYQRNRVWADELVLWKDCVKKSPEKCRPNYNLGRVLAESGRHGQAIFHYKKAISIDPDYFRAHNNLALLYEAQSEYAKAEPLYLMALEICEKILGKDHPSVASTCNNLASLYKIQDKYIAKTESLYLRALKIFEKALDKDHASIASTCYNLASLYQNQNKYAKAEPLYLRALKIFEKILDKDHPSVAATCYNLAELYRIQGKYTQADPLFLRALEINEKILGKDHPFVATTCNNLAELYKIQGKYAQAEPLFLKALEISEIALDKNHPHVATMYYNLAELYKIQGKYAQADPLFLRALEIEEKVLDKDHPFVATHNRLGITFFEKENFQEAISHFKEALRLDPDCASAKKNLELALSRMKNMGNE